MTKSKSTYHRNCHKGPVLVAKQKGIELYGGSVTEAQDNFNEFDLVISLAYIKVPDPIINGKVKSIGLIRLLNDYNPTEHIRIDWPDMSVPQLDESFWNRLANVIKKRGNDRERRNKVFKVICHCFAGHGRTGTLLCILMNKLFGYNNGDIVELVRRLHCYNAVESQSQLRYIEKMTGIELDGETKGTKTFHPVDNKKTIEEIIAQMRKEGLIEDKNRTIIEKPIQKSFRDIKPITQEEIDNRKKVKGIVDIYCVEVKGYSLALHIDEISRLGYCTICKNNEKDNQIKSYYDNKECLPKEDHDNDMMAIGYCRNCGVVGELVS